LAIEDDHFLADKKRAKEILRRLSDFHLRIEFPNGMAIYAIDDEVGELLRKAGVTTVSLAMESGSDFVLKKIIDKPLKLDMVKTAVDILKKNDICVHCCIVLGLPGELEKHREETMQMILKTGFDWSYFNLAVPVAGSRLYDLCKEKGYLINDDFGEHNTSKCNIRTPEIDPEYMEEKAYLMNLEANFVRNHNLTTGNYKRASLYFQNIVQTYPEHAFAHYCMAKSYSGLGRNDEAIYHRNKFIELINTNSMWGRYAKIFELNVC
jgi:anaerobic magnesium-protoporphyrin IX monomethyl ester cyclase